MDEKNNLEKKMVSGILGKIQKNSKIAIIMHDTPDPDALASAHGLQYLLKKKYNSSSDIFYGGEISHPENKAMINVLNLVVKPISEFYESGKYTLIALVDGTEHNIKLKDEYNINIIIDHHRSKIKEGDYQFILNKPAGSCSTLIFDLLMQEGIELTKTDTDKIISTALLFGLIKDSNNLLSDDCVQLDFDAYKKLSTHADLAKIKEIQNYPLPEYFFQFSAKAIQEESFIEINGTYVSFIGYISPAKRDVLPYLSDMFMRRDGISTTVIAAVVGDNIEASVRSTSVSLDVHTFCQKIFGKEHAGGKRGSGGAKIPLGFFELSNDTEEYKEKLISLVRSRLLERVQKEISNE